MRRLAPVVLAMVMVTSDGSPTAIGDSSIQSAILADRGDALPILPLLQAVADARAPQIVSDFSHDGPGASTARAPLASWAWGEILAWNTYPTSLTVPEAMQAWNDSPGHAAVLHGRWAGFGAAVADGPNGAHYYVAIFGTPPAPSPSPLLRSTPRPMVTPVPRTPEPSPSPSPAPDCACVVFRYRDRMTPV